MEVHFTCISLTYLIYALIIKHNHYVTLKDID